MFIAVAQQGGWSQLLARIAAVRPEALAQIPPVTTPAPENSIALLTIVVLALQGVFFAGSPTAGEGSTAQRFMAARSERHAMAGQLLNCFLALCLRILPLIGIGLVALAVFWPASLARSVPPPAGMTVLDDPVSAWGELINRCRLPAGLTGLLIAVEVAAYTSTLSALINWGSSFVINDLYRPLAPDASVQRQIWVSRATTLVLFLASSVVALLFVKQMVGWFMFINSAMVIFLLPLSFFRFFWWRFNVWGELAAIVLGLAALDPRLVRPRLPKRRQTPDVAGTRPVVRTQLRCPGRSRAADASRVNRDLATVLRSLSPSWLVGTSARGVRRTPDRTIAGAARGRFRVGHAGLPRFGPRRQRPLRRRLAAPGRRVRSRSRIWRLAGPARLRARPGAREPVARRNTPRETTLMNLTQTRRQPWPALLLALATGWTALAADATNQWVELRGIDFEGGAHAHFGASHYGRAHVNYVYAQPTLAAATMSARFALPAVPPTPQVLAIEAMDDDAATQCRIRISINGHDLLRGPSGFTDARWQQRSLPIPAGTLQPGTNILTIANEQPEGNLGSPPWFMVARAAVADTGHKLTPIHPRDSRSISQSRPALCRSRRRPGKQNRASSTAAPKAGCGRRSSTSMRSRCCPSSSSTS